MTENELIECADRHFSNRHPDDTVAEAYANLDSGLNDPVAVLVAGRIESAVTNSEPDKRAAFLVDQLLQAKRDIETIAATYQEEATRSASQV